MSFDDEELKQVMVWAASWRDPVEIVDSEGNVYRGLIKGFGPRRTHLQISGTRRFESIPTDSIVSVSNLMEQKGAEEFFPRWERPSSN